MKKIILLSCVALSVTCKPQKNDKQDHLKGNLPNSIPVTEMKNNFQINSNQKVTENVEISEETEYKGMIIKYQENLKVSKEDLENIPSEFKERIITLFSKPIFYELKTDFKQSSYQTIAGDSKVYSTSDAGRTNETTVIIPTLNVYKDFEKLVLHKQDQLIDKIYLISDQLEKIDWKITSEKEKINNFVCRKATATVNHKDVTAYFTDEIPIGDGPSIYYGLPGLILRVEAPDRSYTVMEINYKDHLEIEKFKNGIVISVKDFEKLMKKMKENPTTIINNEIRQ